MRRETWEGKGKWEKKRGYGKGRGGKRGTEGKMGQVGKFTFLSLPLSLTYYTLPDITNCLDYISPLPRGEGDMKFYTPPKDTVMSMLS